MNSIAGVVEIDEGDIVLDGQSIQRLLLHVQKDISRVFQDPRMGTATNLTIEENMAIAYRRGKKRSFFKINHRNRASIVQGKIIRAWFRFGKSHENRCGISIRWSTSSIDSCYGDLGSTKNSLLDEHTAALDPKTSDMVMQLTRSS